jgi:hypothetical protein
MGQFLKSSPNQPSEPSCFSFPFLIFFPCAGCPAQLAQCTLACPACLLSSPRPTLILTHSSPAEAEPSAHTATCHAPLPWMSHRPRLCTHAPVLAMDSIVLCAPHHHLIPSNETLNRSKTKKTRIKFMSNPQRNLQESLIRLEELFGTLFCLCWTPWPINRST